MNAHYKYLLVLLILAMPLTAEGHEYESTTLENAIDVNSDQTDMAYDSAHHLGICYKDGTNDALKFAFYDGATWDKETVETGNGAGGMGHRCRVVFNSADEPQIIYYDVVQNRIRHASKQGGIWTLRTVEAGLGIDQVGNSPYGYDALGLVKKNGSDDLGVAYYNATGRDLKYATFNGAAWATETVLSAGDVGRYASLAFDADDHAVIAYQEYVDANTQRLKIVAHNGLAWDAAETVWDAGKGASDIGLKIDADDNSHVVFKRVGDDTLIYLDYVQKTAEGWSAPTNLSSITTTLTPEPSFGSATPFVLDEDNNLFFLTRYYFPSALFGNWGHLILKSAYFYGDDEYFHSSASDRMETMWGGHSNFTALSLAHRDQEMAMAWVKANGDLMVAMVSSWTPAVNMVDPQVDTPADATFTASWKTFDPDGIARIRFYYRDADFNRTLIDEIDSAEEGELEWNTSGVAAGEYDLIAQISEINFADYAESYSPQQVVVSHAVVGGAGEEAGAEAGDDAGAGAGAEAGDGAGNGAGSESGSNSASDAGEDEGEEDGASETDDNSGEGQNGAVLIADAAQGAAGCSLMPVMDSVQNNLHTTEKCNNIFTWIFLMAVTVLAPRFLKVGSPVSSRQ